jgi:hypothetical protein
MSYYVYENWQAGPHKAVIHIGSCGFCNDGKGRARGYDPNHAQWHGPFPTIIGAKKVRLMKNGDVYWHECRCIKH